MIKDIRLALTPAIRDGMNFASVILIFVGMDFMGSFLTGKGKPTKDNIIKFFSLMSEVVNDKRYDNMKLVLYNGFRNGLIHNYFAGKPKFVISINKYAENGIAFPDPGVHLKYTKYLNEGSIHVTIDSYCLFNDFEKTTNYILNKIESQPSGGIFYEAYKSRWQELTTQAKEKFEEDVLNEINQLP